LTDSDRGHEPYGPRSGKETSVVPRKVRELVAELERAGFVNRGGKAAIGTLFIHW